MKLTGLEIFDSTIQRTNSWLKDLMHELNWSDHRKAYLAFRCVLHAVRDHVAAPNAVEIGEQLPMLLRGMYFEGWNPAKQPAPLRSRAEFLSILGGYLARDGENTSDPEIAARAVFRLLDRKATDGEIADLQPFMPPSLTDLWPPTLRAA